MRFALFGIGALIAGLTGAAHALTFTASYDIETRGIPKFVNVNYIDLQKVAQLSKFRSSDGHDYSDTSQFGTVQTANTHGVRDAAGKVEACRSMKHYFRGVEAGTNIYAPVSGTITSFEADGGLGGQIEIQSDEQPAFYFIIFHGVPNADYAVGQHVEAGQLLGHHFGSPLVASDIAVFVNTPNGQHLISYFETLTDEAFAPYQARGIATREQLIFTKAERDADPYQCTSAMFPPARFFNLKRDPSLDLVTLTGGAPRQTVTATAPPETLSLNGPPLKLSATASTGLPITYGTNTPAVCSVSGDMLTPLAAGQCLITYVQEGNADLFRGFAQNFTIVTAGLNAGPIYSSAQASAQSFMRFHNKGTTAGTVTAVLNNAATGQPLGTWTSPSIPAGAEQQFSIATLETALPSGTPVPAYFTVLVQPSMTGTLQHVLYRPADGTLTNLSTCALGSGADPRVVAAVHSSRLGAGGFASTVVVANTGDASGRASLGLYDARNGNKLGTYETASIAAGGKAVIEVSTIETGLNLVPSAEQFHYIVKLEGSFAGFLQHLVNNVRANVITDMTTMCTLDGSVPARVSGGLNAGVIFSSAQASAQSFLRFFNRSSFEAGAVTLTLSDATTGQKLGTWTSPPLATRGEQQFSIAAIESAIGMAGAKPAFYSVSLQTNIPMYFQHVLWHAADGTLTNLSTCASGVEIQTYLNLSGVHSTLVGAAGYPSTVAITNASAAPVSFALYVHDARDGRYLGIGANPSVPGNGTVFVEMATIESALRLTPDAGQYHFNISSFIPSGPSINGTRAQAGYLQHLVSNQRTGVITDMSVACALNP